MIIDRLVLHCKMVKITCILCRVNKNVFKIDVNAFYGPIFVMFFVLTLTVLRVIISLMRIIDMNIWDMGSRIGIQFFYRKWFFS